MNTMKIMQYNVQKSRLGVMTPLLERQEQLGIIAIQEPWINLQIQATYCPADSPYTSVFPNAGRARTCFLINKGIPVSMSTQEANHITPDYCSITIQLATGPLTIHNVYSPIPPTVNSTEWETPLGNMLQNVSNTEGEHLVEGDFNLYHPLWGGPSVDRPNKGAARLVEAAETGMLKLLSVPGIPTREKNKNRPSTLDLTFATVKTFSRFHVDLIVHITI